MQTLTPIPRFQPPTYTLRHPFKPSLLACAVSGAVLACANSAAYAQSNADSGSKLESVIVTAQKRPQTLLDVPASIQAMTAEQVRELGITDFVSLSQYTPGVIASNQAVGGRTVQTFTIRGVGMDDSRPNGSPSAAVHFDGVYQGSAALIGGQMFDVERVEILKGPQGTLYGRNTTAGAINVISRKPGKTFEGSAEIDYGSFGSVRTQVAVGGALDERWGVRIAGVYDRTDGYITNVGPGTFGGYTVNAARIPPNGSPAVDDKAAGTNFSGVRSLVTFNPAPGTSLLFNLHGFHEAGGVAQAERTLPSAKYPANLPYTFDSNMVPRVGKNSNGMSLTLDQELANDVLLTVIGGYETLAQRFDWNDGTPIRTADIYYGDHVEQQSIEARLRNNDGGEHGIDWVVGGIYYKDKVDMLSTIDGADQLRSSLTADYGQTRTSWAMFGDVSKKLSQQWTVGMGLRYTDERSTFQGSTTDNNPYGTSIVRLAVPTIPVFFNESFNDARWSGKGTVSYRPGADTTYYGSIGQGFKAGGFDGTTITSVPEAAPFRSETVLSYEAGMKFLPNGPIQVDASGFYYDYTDMQANTTKIVATLPTGVRTNVGKSRIYGAELNVVARPTRGLDLIFGMSALNSRITEVVSDSPAEAARRLGNQVPNAPKFSTRATVRYQYPVAADTVLVSSLSGRYVGQYFTELDNFQAVGGDFVADARMELRFGKRWTLAAWVKNLTDRAYGTGGAVSNASTLNVYRAAPRTVGLNASIKF